jgi:hypothetical protein
LALASHREQGYLSNGTPLPQYSSRYLFLLRLNLKIIIQKTTAQAEMITWVERDQLSYLQ